MRSNILMAAGAAVALTWGAFVPTSAQAQGAFCAEQGGRSGYRNCGYYTYGQCRASVSGVGGYCYPNPEADYGGNGYGRRGPVYGGDYGYGYDVPPPPRYYRPY